jgi:hypothetical protein
MDIAALSTSMSSAGLGQAVGIRVMKMAQEAAVQQNQEMIKAMQQSVQPHLGQSIDIKA